MSKHVLFVCKTCATIWKDGKPQGKSGGQELIENISELHQNWELRDEFPIQEIQCMSACSHSCTVSFAAAGKHTYLFGDLPAQNSAAAVLECAAKYYSNPDGLLPWSERPEPLKKGIIARIPPIN